MSDAGDEQPRRRPQLLFAILAADIWGNRKVRRAAARSGGRSTLVFAFALTRNAARGRTGSFPASDLEPWYLADQTGMSEDEATQALACSIEARLLEVDGETAYLVGWDETWKRGALTQAESEARKERRARAKQAQPPPNQKEKNKKREKTQTQNKRSPDFARTMSGQGVCEPPATELEEQNALRIAATIARYTDIQKIFPHEIAHLVRVARSGHRWDHLEALAAYTCDAGGANWAAKRDRTGHEYMRAHCTVLGIFTEKNIANNLATAISPNAWTPSRWERAS